MATLAIKQPLLHRVSWGGLFAGFFFGFGIWMLLLSLGAGIGLSSFDPRDVSNWQGLGIGVGIWGIIAGIISLFVAGWLTARLGTAESKLSGMLHGAALWGFMLVAGVWIAVSAIGATASTAAQAAGTAAAGAASGAGSAAANPSTRRQMQQQGSQLQQQAQGLARQAEQNAGEAASTAKTAGAAGAWAFFVYGLLTLAAAILGGWVGAPEEHLAVTREQRAPTAPLAPPSPQRV